MPPGEETTWPVAVVGNKWDLLPVSERNQGPALSFIRDLIPYEDEEVTPPTPPSELAPVITTTATTTTATTNGAAISHISIYGQNYPRATDVMLNGTQSSVRTGNTIYHTPSSSVFDGSSWNGSMHTALESVPAPSERSLSRSRGQRSIPSSLSSLSSSSQTITPSVYTRLGGMESDSDDGDTGDSTPTQGSHRSALERGAQLFFTSAKTGEGVTEVFTYIAARTAARMKWLERVEARTLHLAEGSLSGPGVPQARSFRLGDLIGQSQAWRTGCCS